MIPGPFSDQFSYASKPRASGDDPHTLFYASPLIR